MKLSRLSVEYARLKMHVENFKKATAYFAKDALSRYGWIDAQRADYRCQACARCKSDEGNHTPGTPLGSGWVRRCAPTTGGDAAAESAHSCDGAKHFIRAVPTEEGRLAAPHGR